MFQTKDQAIGAIRYVGISRAVVIDNNDPLKRGRIRVNSPVLGETNWLPYLTAPGTFNVPAVDSVVYIECDGGFYTHPVAFGNLNYGDDDDLQFPEEFQRASPTNRGWYTPEGHMLEIDDGEDAAGTKRGIRLTTVDATTLFINDETTDHSATLTFDDGLVIKFDGTNDIATIDTNNGEHLELSKANGFQLSTPDDGGTSASFKGGKIDILANKDTTWTSTTGKIDLTADKDITLTTNNGKLVINTKQDINFTTSNGGFDFKDSYPNEIKMSSAGIDIKDKSSNEIVMTSAGLKLKATGGTVAILNLAGGKVALGTSTTELLNELITLLNAFTTGAPTFVSTSVGPGVLNPSVASAISTFTTNVGNIKGTV